MLGDQCQDLDNCPGIGQYLGVLWCPKTHTLAQTSSLVACALSEVLLAGVQLPGSPSFVYEFSSTEVITFCFADFSNAKSLVLEKLDSIESDFFALLLPFSHQRLTYIATSTRACHYTS